ncbi:MAG TPA: sulfur carrier protein ThiS [Jatrophihabitans sp.]|nr:sulfur carrier protein ThiS [Jatrophihabitans sp.]
MTGSVLVVNGAERPVPQPATVGALLIDLGLRPGTVVVELNGTALAASEAAGAGLAAGDRVEIVRAVPGG